MVRHTYKSVPGIWAGTPADWGTSGKFGFEDRPKTSKPWNISSARQAVASAGVWVPSGLLRFGRFWRANPESGPGDSKNRGPPFGWVFQGKTLRKPRWRFKTPLVPQAQPPPGPGAACRNSQILDQRRCSTAWSEHRMRRPPLL